MSKAKHYQGGIKEKPPQKPENLKPPRNRLKVFDILTARMAQLTQFNLYGLVQLIINEHQLTGVTLHGVYRWKAQDTSESITSFVLSAVQFDEVTTKQEMPHEWFDVKDTSGTAIQ